MGLRPAQGAETVAGGRNEYREKAQSAELREEVRARGVRYAVNEGKYEIQNEVIYW